ncbi:glycoside hydrolase family 99-like domain-containing protein [Paraburkholderia xenovorans]
MLRPYVQQALMERSAAASSNAFAGSSVPEVLAQLPLEFREVMHRACFAPLVARHGEYRKNAERALDAKTLIRYVAFYVPDAGDENHGGGLSHSRWTSVVRRAPRVLGEYQPHIPEELGFYETDDAELLKRQVTLARRYGVEAFCFYVIIGENPFRFPAALEVFLLDRNIAFKFCICLTTHLPGEDCADRTSEVYPSERLHEVVSQLNRAFDDPRYVRADQNPLLVMFDAGEARSLHRSANGIRDMVREINGRELHLVATPLSSGDGARAFDAVAHFPPFDGDRTDLARAVRLDPSWEGTVVDYAAVINSFAAPDDGSTSAVREYSCVVPSWDSYGARSTLYLGATPAQYALWLAQACVGAQSLRQTNRFVFVNAWNAWRQSAHLEPDQYFGCGYLEATRRTLEAFGPSRPNDWAMPAHEVAVVLHLHYVELWPEIAGFLRNLPTGFGLYVSIGEAALAGTEAEIQAIFPNAVVLRIENRGRDVLPFLTLMKYVVADGRRYVCKIHSKKSKHRVDGDIWREDLYGKLLGSREIVADNIFALLSRPGLGLLGPAGHMVPSSFYWGGNAENVTRLGREFGLDAAHMTYEFAAGTMFWAKVEGLKPLLDLGLTRDSFEAEAGQIDGTLAHALERAIPLAIATAGMYTTDTNWINPSRASCLRSAVTDDYAWAAGTKPADF